jgi:tripartite-type tricarboxylate transporter receptor subunit TctC
VKRYHRTLRAALRRLPLLAVGLLSRHAASADEVSDFYHGKTIDMIVGTGESAGAVEAYPRALAQVIGKYIPGHPTVIVSNMPGAGGIKAADYIYKVAPQDGTYWGFITRGFLLAPLLKMPGADFDPTKFNWMGSPARSVSVGVTWTASTPVRTIEQTTRTQVVVGATSVGQDTGVFPAMLNRFIGAKFKIVPGYPSVGQIDLAMESGEVQGKVGFTWSSLNSGRTVSWVKSGKVSVIVQLGLKKDPHIPSSVPLALDLAKSPADREAMEVLCAPSETGYPSFIGPGVPKARVDALRAAYLRAIADPEFNDILHKQSLDLDVIPADDVTAVVKSIYALPASAVQSAVKVLNGP